MTNQIITSYNELLRWASSIGGEVNFQSLSATAEEAAQPDFTNLPTENAGWQALRDPNSAAKHINSILPRLEDIWEAIVGGKDHYSEMVGHCKKTGITTPVDRFRSDASYVPELMRRAESVRQPILNAFQNLDPRKALAGGTGLSVAAASGWTILNTPIGILASEVCGIGFGYTALLAGGAATVGGAAGVGVGYGIHKGVEAVQGKNIGLMWYDTNALGAQSFAKWTTEAELFGGHPLDVSGWF